MGFYAASKHINEVHAGAFGRSCGLEWVALLLGVLYGARLRCGLSSRLLLSVLDDVDAGRLTLVNVDPDAGLAWVYVDGAAECFERALFGEVASTPLNVSTGRATRLEDVLRTLLRAYGAAEDIHWVAGRPTGTYSSVRYYDPSHTPAARVPHWQTCSPA